MAIDKDAFIKKLAGGGDTEPDPADPAEPSEGMGGGEQLCEAVAAGDYAAVEEAVRRIVGG